MHLSDPQPVVSLVFVSPMNEASADIPMMDLLLYGAKPWTVDKWPATVVLAVIFDRDT